MIDWIVRNIFKWDLLREAIFAEVDLYNSIKWIMADPEEMRPVTAIWCDNDGWRGWSQKDNRYYFNDVPEKSLRDIFDILIG
jgi:hypothetical protein